MQSIQKFNLNLKFLSPNSSKLVTTLMNVWHAKQKQVNSVFERQKITAFRLDYEYAESAQTWGPQDTK